LAVILLPRKHKVQPQYPTQIDRERLGKSAKFLINPAVGTHDLITGRHWTLGATATVIPAEPGKVINFAVGDYLEYTGYAELTGSIGTFAAWLPVVGNPQGFGSIYLVESTATVYHQFHTNGTIYFAGVASTGVISNWFNTTNRSFVMTSNGTAASTKVYIDGKDSTLTWASAPTAWPAGSKQIWIGNYMSAGFESEGTMLNVVHDGRRWSSYEAKLYHDTQGRCLFRAPQRRLEFPVAAGGGGGTTVFRSTLSAFGSRSGSRQVHR
jgi:hypothetical protein